MAASDPGYVIALEEAETSIAEGGHPIGAAIVSPSGEVLGRGHNTRLQSGSAILHVGFRAFSLCCLPPPAHAIAVGRNRGLRISEAPSVSSVQGRNTVHHTLAVPNVRGFNAPVQD